MHRSLTASDLDLIAKTISILPEAVENCGVEIREYDANAVVLPEGGVEDIACLILLGSVRTALQADHGGLITLERHERGALLDKAMFSQRLWSRQARVLAATRSLVALIPSSLLHAREDASAEYGEQKAIESDGVIDHLNDLSETGARMAALLQEEGKFEALEIKAGDVLFEEGDAADFACLVLTGRLEALQWDQGVQKVIGSSGPGTLVGELGVLDHQPRAATVRALEKSTVVFLSADLTRRLCSTAGLSSLTSALRAAYALSGWGIAYSVLTPGADEDEILTTIQLEDNRVVSVTRGLKSRMVVARATTLPDKILRSQNGRLKIGIADDRLVLVEGPEGWADLPKLMEYLLAGRILESWRQSAFETNETFLFTNETELLPDSVACACTGASVAKIRGHAAGGATTLRDIEQACGAGGVCGGCRSRISTLLGRENFTLCQAKVSSLCSGAVRLLLEPIGSTFPTISPGQHVAVDGLVDGAWLTRSYTVVHCNAQTLELGVKIEQYGEFSRWLATQTEPTLMRVSQPQGDPITAGGPPLMFLVAGIGVTPAIAALRAVSDQRRLDITYIYRSRDVAAYLTELEDAAKDGLIEFRGICTTETDRPDLKSLIESALTASGSEEAFVCGPPEWAETITGLLKEKGITVRTEAFTHSGTSGGPALVCPGSWRDAAKPHTSPNWTQYTLDNPGTQLDESRSFIEQFFSEHDGMGGFESRWREVEGEIQSTGSYHQTIEEMSFGAKVAWRNSTKCIGRLYWSGLKVRDCRHIKHPDDVATELFKHLDLAYNNGNLKPVMTVFDPGSIDQPAVRIWNPQLMRYAGYQNGQEKPVGDPAQLELTRAIQKLGWRGVGSDFDLLPIVVEVAGHKPQVYEIPAEQRYEVDIRHPDYPRLHELGLKWYAVPAVSDMALDCGGILYRCAPFNGWYMATEIGARNFTDVERYNLALEVAQKLGLDTSRESNLWRDKVLIAMTEAVLWSFEADGVKIADHFSASLEFLQFCKNEQEQGRDVQGHWPWLVPPIGGSATPLFLDQWNDLDIKPALRPQDPCSWEG